MQLNESILTDDHYSKAQRSCVTYSRWQHTNQLQPQCSSLIRLHGAAASVLMPPVLTKIGHYPGCAFTKLNRAELTVCIYVQPI